MANGSDDYIRSISKFIVVNTFLKYCVIVLAITVVAQAIVLLSIMGKIQEVKPLPIYINKDTGSAIPVDFNVLDATGENRIPAEILDFCRNYVANLYTFNRYTIKSNLDSVFNQSTAEVIEKLKYYMNETERPKFVNSTAQGVCKILFNEVVTTQPDIKVQVAFERSILNERGEEEKTEKMYAIMRLKTIVRNMKNSHGLLVIEYRESAMEEDRNEKVE